MTTFITTFSRSPKTRKAVGVVLVVIGVVAFVTPLTPGSWLALIGFELLGVRVLLPERLAARLPFKRTLRGSEAKKPPPLTNEPPTYT